MCIRDRILPTADSFTRRTLDDALRSVGAEPVVVAEIDSIVTTIELVRRTQLGAIVSRLAAPDTPDLQIVALESPTPVRTPGLLNKTGRHPSAALRSFIGILRRKALQHQRLRAKPPPAAGKAPTPA